MDRKVRSFHLNKQRSFNYGQIDVAISRAKTLQGIYALGKIEQKHVVEQIVKYMKNMKD